MNDQPWLVDLQLQLSKQIAETTLPHGLIISGIKGSGYDNLANWLLSVLICQNKLVAENQILQACQHCKACQLRQAGHYPDHLTISAEKNSLGVDEVRRLSHFFEKTALIGQIKTAIITQADTMTVSAANALLKTLEEPTANSFIILTTEQIASLLPTVISRCQQIQIRPAMGNNLHASLTNSRTFVDETKVDKFTNLTHLPELTQADIAEDFQKLSTLFQQFLAKNNLARHEHRNELVVMLSEHEYALRWLEKIIVDLTRTSYGWCSKPMSRQYGAGQQTTPALIATSELTTKPIVESTPEPALAQDDVWQIYRLIATVKQTIKKQPQANKRLMVEKLLLDIASV